MKWQTTLRIWKFTVSLVVNALDIDPSDKDMAVGIKLSVKWK